jgi:uncharacterized protein YcbK (DUF882 family)
MFVDRSPTFWDNRAEHGHRMRTKRVTNRLERIALLTTVLFLVAPLAILTRCATAPVQSLPDHRLRLYHTHTGERLDIVYRRGDTYLGQAIERIDYFLRDHRTGAVRHFDPRLYDVLEDLTAAVGRPGGEIDIVCGYRSPWSNGFLRSHTAGVAKNSLHMQAEAIDLRMPGVETYQLRQAALSLHRGGVGYYPRSDFIHVDLGRVRQWCLGCTSSVSGRAASD